MGNTILAMLEENAPSFSKGQKRIARYILADLQKAALMTAGMLAKETEVSESTVVRFAAELGYAGFPQMQKALQDALMEHLISATARPGKSCMQMLDGEEFSKAVRSILDARRIYLIANGANAALASYLGYHLDKLFPDVHILSSASNKLHHAGAEDVAIVFDFPPYSVEIEKTAAYCGDSGTKVIGITSSERSPICPKCDCLFFVFSERTNFGYSLSEAFSFVEALLQACMFGKEVKTDEV